MSMTCLDIVLISSYSEMESISSEIFNNKHLLALLRREQEVFINETKSRGIIHWEAVRQI